MPAAALAAALAQARTVILALTPTTATPTAAFSAADGLLPLDAEPPVASDRVFEVAPTGGHALGPRWGDSYEEHVADFAVEIRYDAGRGATDASARNLATAADRIAEDADQIAKAITTRANYASGTQIVVLSGSTVDRGDPEFPKIVLTFRCTYLVAL